MADLKSVYDSEDDIPETLEEVRSLFTERDGKWELTGIPGVANAAKVAALEQSLAHEKEQRKAVNLKLEAWGDMDHAEVQAKLDRIAELEAAASGNLDEDKLKMLADKRAEGIVATKLAPIQRELSKAQKERDALKASDSEKGRDLERYSLRDSLRDVMVEANVAPEHQEDVLLYGERHLETTDGVWRARQGIDGITAGATPKDWLEEMLKRRPGWLPASAGAGARGSEKTARTTGGNPWTAEGWNMTEQGQVVNQKGLEAAERLAKAAGTTIGGPRPDPKK